MKSLIRFVDVHAPHPMWVWLSIAIACAAVGCPSARPAERPAIYELELTSCTEKSATLTESIVCENEVRGRYGRPLRPLPGDGGAR